MRQLKWKNQQKKIQLQKSRILLQELSPRLISGDFLFLAMRKEDCFELGKITKPHGLKGEVIFWLDVDVPEEYAYLETVLLELKGDLVPYIIESIQIRGKKAIVKLDEVKSIEDTDSLINCNLYLPLDKLPELDGNSFYYHEIIGYRIYDLEEKREIGTIKTVFEGPGHDMFSLEIQDKEVLIPIVDEFLIHVNRLEKIVEMRIPHGLIDLYLDT